VNLTGIVLSAAPIGEYDKRLVIITKERGRITTFAKGARRQNSALLAAANPFVFGEFTLFAGRNSYNLMQADIQNYFMDLRSDFEAVCYGLYFLEFTDYYTHENNDEIQMIQLLYASLRALTKEALADKRLIRYIFELKALVVNGEYPEVFSCHACGAENNLEYFSNSRAGVICKNCKDLVSDRIRISDSTIYTLQYIVSSPINKLYTFTVSEEVLRELRRLMEQYMKNYVNKKFKSLEILTDIKLM
jgi:DNA repair protein RecO (recombination protein O)